MLFSPIRALGRGEGSGLEEPLPKSLSEAARDFKDFLRIIEPLILALRNDAKVIKALFTVCIDLPIDSPQVKVIHGSSSPYRLA